MAKGKTFPDAAVLGGASKLRELLSAGADIHERDENGRTALFRVCRVGHVDKARMLLEASADPNATDDLGEAPLQAAARYGHAECVEVLLKAGAAINYCPPSSKTEFSESALHSAMRKSRETAKPLLAHGADPNAATDAKRFPLFAAIERCDAELTALLLKHQASVSARDSHDDTPLHVAVRQLEPSMVTMLLDYGADPNARNDRGETPIFDGIARAESALATVQALLVARPDLSIKDAVFKETPLQRAIRHGAAEIADALLDAGSPGAPPEPDTEVTITVNLDDSEGAEGLEGTEGAEPEETDWRFFMETVNEKDLLPTAQETEWARQVDLEVPSLFSLLGDRVSRPHWEFLKHAEEPLSLTRMAYFARGYFNRPAGQELEDGKQILAETYESAAERFVAKGFLQRVAGARAICIAFAQSELARMAKQNEIKSSGSKSELAQRLVSVLGEDAFAEKLRAQGGYFELTPLGAGEVGRFQSVRTDLEVDQRQAILAALTEHDFLRAATGSRILALLKNPNTSAKVQTRPANIAHARFIRSCQLPSSLRFSPGAEARYLVIASADAICDPGGDDWDAWDVALEPPKTVQGQPVPLPVFSSALLGRLL